jgi:hypothetical protein
MTRSMAVLLAALSFGWSAVRAQEPSPAALVVVIKGESRYHVPSCPLVAKAGSNVTMMKLAEATKRGLSAHDCEDAAVEQPKKDANAVPVFVQRDDKRYHKEGCAKLGAGATKITLGEAGKKYWPCPVCKPPIRQREKGAS